MLPDIVFVPLAAFDRRGHRIGFGAGYYDRTLASLRSMKPILAVGTAYSVQEVPAIPEEPHDQRLDLVGGEHEQIGSGRGVLGVGQPHHDAVVAAHG